MAKKNPREEWKIYGNVFDEHTRRVLFKLESQGHFTALSGSLATGKEANVFLADTADKKRVIVKIYRLENCNFNKMYEYLSQDERYLMLKGQRRKIIFSWVQREYRNLLIAREVIRVPTPLAVKDNVLVLELIGEPALQLKDAPPKDPVAFLDEIVDNMKSLKKAGLIHGDLSAFNILNLNERPVFIDFSQATTTKSSGWQELLRRDVHNIVTHFKKLNVERTIDDVLRVISSP